MGLLGAAKDKEQFELIPVAEYVWTLWDMQLDNGQWGEQIKWVWLISPISDPDAYITKKDGNEREVWQFSKPTLAKGSRARKWAEALLGRELKTGEEPDDDDLIRRRMIAMLVHKAKKSDPTVKNEAISEEMDPRAFRASKPSTSVSDNPTEADVDAALAALDALHARVKKAIRNADLDDITSLPKWGALDEIDVGNLSEDQLHDLEADIKAERRKVAA